jgi:dipeptidyl aminopeptidase/acylaminoacyl peptidase
LAFNSFIKKQTVMKQRLLLAAFFLLPLFIIAQKNWTPEQCLKIKNITAVVPSPDGMKILYTVREAVMTDDRSEYVNQVWLCNNDGSNAVQLTKGDKNSSNPKWSPDGKWIAFTSSRESKNNLYILAVGGGESEKLTDVKTSVGNYDWSRDGKMIAFAMLDAAADKEEKDKKAKNDWYYMDEEIKQNRLYVLWLDKKDTAGKYVQKKITKENYNVNAFDWSADGRSIAYSFGKSPEVNDNVYSNISLIDIETGNIKPIASTAAGETNPQFSPDGKFIAYYCTADPVDWSGPRHAKVYSITDGKSWRLKATPNEDGGIIGWTPDGKNILWTEANKTFNSIYQLSVDGKNITEWSKGAKDLLGGSTLNTTGTVIGFTLQNPSQLPEAYISSLSNFSPAKVTSINTEHANKPLPKTALIKWKGADGKDIEGLLTYPIGYQPGQKVPFILNVHGGPAGVDEVIKMGVADETKMGVMGWSYGGFMSSWIVGHTDRFKVASIGAPVVDLAHQNLTDDIEGFLPSYFQSNPWDDWSKYDTHSPLRFVQNVKTPVMLQHGEADARVPFSNSVMFYNALRRRNVPVRLLALPRQPHGPTEPRMILKVMQTNVEWFEKYIGDKKGF